MCPLPWGSLALTGIGVPRAGALMSLRVRRSASDGDCCVLLPDGGSSLSVDGELGQDGGSG